MRRCRCDAVSKEWWKLIPPHLRKRAYVIAIQQVRIEPGYCFVDTHIKSINIMEDKR